MGDHQLMSFGNRRQRLRRDSHVAALVLHRRRLTAFQKRISAKGHDDLHRSTAERRDQGCLDRVHAILRLIEHDWHCRLEHLLGDFRRRSRIFGNQEPGACLGTLRLESP